MNQVQALIFKYCTQSILILASSFLKRLTSSNLEAKRAQIKTSGKSLILSKNEDKNYSTATFIKIYLNCYLAAITST